MEITHEIRRDDKFKQWVEVKYDEHDQQIAYETRACFMDSYKEVRKNTMAGIHQFESAMMCLKDAEYLLRGNVVLFEREEM